MGWERVSVLCGPQPLGASPPADGGAIPAMPSGHDCHASRQVSSQQDGCAQQVQGESPGPFRNSVSVCGRVDSLGIPAVSLSRLGVVKGLRGCVTELQ